MTPLADVAPDSSGWHLGLLVCGCLSCLFLVSLAILIVILVRRNRRQPKA